MRIESVRWIPAIVDKLAAKHDVTIEEVESVLFARPHVRFVERGDVAGEDVYSAMGLTHPGNRYLVVFYVAKEDRSALVISARTMSASERKAYERR